MTLTYKELQARVQGMEQTVSRNAQHIQHEGHLIDDDARDTGRVAEQIAAKGVDRSTVAECQDLARITSGFSDAVIGYAAAGQDTARYARAASEQATSSHAGIQEAVARSRVDGITDVDADWFEQQ